MTGHNRIPTKAPLISGRVIILLTEAAILLLAFVPFLIIAVFA